MPRAPWRVTADDYEVFVIELCGMPPGTERDECVRELTGRLLTLYAEHGASPPPGLRNFADRIGLPAAGEESA